MASHAKWLSPDEFDSTQCVHEEDDVKELDSFFYAFQAGCLFDLSLLFWRTAVLRGCLNEMQCLNLFCALESEPDDEDPSPD